MKLANTDTTHFFAKENNVENNIYSLVTSYFGRLKKVAQLLPIVALCSLMFANPAFAGLQQANTALEEIKTWAYTILGIGIFLYIMYHIIMALLNKGQWSDVVMAVVYSAIAGAAIALGEWAWSIWGS